MRLNLKWASKLEPENEFLKRNLVLYKRELADQIIKMFEKNDNEINLIDLNELKSVKFHDSVKTPTQNDVYESLCRGDDQYVIFSCCSDYHFRFFVYFSN